MTNLYANSLSVAVLNEQDSNLKKTIKKCLSDNNIDKDMSEVSIGNIFCALSSIYEMVKD